MGYFRAFFRLMRIILITIRRLYSIIIIEKIKGASRSRAHKSLQRWGMSILDVLGVKIVGEVPDLPRGVLLLPNHRSYIDIFLVQALYPSSIVSKKEVGRWPLIRHAVRICEIILVDRSLVSSKIETIKQIKEKVINGQSVILFPEGTTTMGPELKPLKNGTFRISSENSIPVVPLAIEYKYQDAAWVGDDTFFRHFFDFFRRKENPVSIRFGTSITLDRLDELKSTYGDWMNKNLREMRDDWDKS